MPTLPETATACEDRVTLLVDLLFDDGAAFAPEVRRELDAHLATCAACRAELVLMRDGHASLHASAADVAPLHLAGFAARTADRAEAFRDRSLRGLWWSLTRGMRLASIGSMAALTAAALLVVVASTGPVTSTGSTPTFAEARVASAAGVDSNGGPDAEADLPVVADAESLADNLVQQAMLDPVGIGLDTGFEALDDDQLEDLLELLAAGS